jgi:hypothetical protein
MGNLSANRARELLGGDINGHDLVAGHANRNGLTLLTTPHRWQWRPRGERGPRRPADGSRLINTALVLLFVLADGLLVVSYAAQYAYTLAERHQNIAAAIEAGALDVGMIIFSLLALGLARKGQSAKVERALVVACAAGSSLMNFAPANSASWRSVLVWIMPPIFLAVVVDRCVRTVQRHVLASTAHETDSRSPWAVLGLAAYRTARFTVLAALYSLRFVIDRSGTWTGVRQAIINATPLPAPPPVPELASIPGKSAACECPAPYYPGGPVPCVVAGRCMRLPDPPPARCLQCGTTPSWGTVHVCPGPRAKVADQSSLPGRRGCPSDAGMTKTERLLTLVSLHHGDLAGIPLDEVSKIATACAPDVDMHPASARSALLAAVRRAIATCGSDSK